MGRNATDLRTSCRKFLATPSEYKLQHPVWPKVLKMRAFPNIRTKQLAL